MTSPDPVPLPPLPVAAIVTTDGTTSLATWVTAHALTVGEEPAVGVEAGELDVQPPTTKVAPAATHGSHRRELCGCFDSITSAPCSIAHLSNADNLPKVSCTANWLRP
jgi:hypothetical protein